MRDARLRIADVGAEVKEGNMQNAKKPRGFAAMTPEARSEISRKGGKTAHAMGRAHRYTSEEARIAGRKGGLLSRKNHHTSKEPTTMRCKCGHVQTLPFESFRSLSEQLAEKRCLSCGAAGALTHVKEEETAA